MHTHFISKEHLSIDLIAEILKSNAKLALSESAITAIVKCRTYLDNKMANSTKPVYGINTGFGSLCDVKINTEDLSQLQKNLVMSHATRNCTLNVITENTIFSLWAFGCAIKNSRKIN